MVLGTFYQQSVKVENKHSFFLYSRCDAFGFCLVAGFGLNTEAKIQLVCDWTREILSVFLISGTVTQDWAKNNNEKKSAFLVSF